MEIDVVCTTNPSGGWNITSVDLMTDISGSWKANQTHNALATVGTEVVANFTINKRHNASLEEGDHLFGCRATQVKNEMIGITESGVNPSKTHASANRTLHVQYPPNVTIRGPPDNNWSKNKRVNISYIPLTVNDAGTSLLTRIWTNESGSWAPGTGSIIVSNNTLRSQDYIFLELTNIVWGIEVTQQNDGNVFNFSVNRTISIDTINPTITSASPADNSISGSSFTITYIPTEANINTTVILVGNFSQENYTNISANSGETITHTVTGLLDGNINFSIIVNDSSGRIVQTLNRTVIVDITATNS